MPRIVSLALVAFFGCSALAFAEESDWIKMFNGKNLDGWKASENKSSWKVEDGAVVCHGPRSHLFYEADEPFKNFEFQCEVKTTPGSNAGIYFHTKYQEDGWPKYGYEVQVNNTHGDPKKTGGLYAVSDVFKAPAKDNEWFTMTIRVEGKRIITKVNGKQLVDFTEEKDRQPGAAFTRVVDKGTFALQAHDPKSKVYFRDLKVKRLP